MICYNGGKDKGIPLPDPDRVDRTDERSKPYEVHIRL